VSVRKNILTFDRREMSHRSYQDREVVATRSGGGSGTGETIDVNSVIDDAYLPRLDNVTLSQTFRHGLRDSNHASGAIQNVSINPSQRKERVSSEHEPAAQRESYRQRRQVIILRRMRHKPKVNRGPREQVDRLPRK